MKAKSFISDKGIVTVTEDEHKQVYITIGEVSMEFTSFDAALNWAKKEVFNGANIPRVFDDVCHS